MGCGDVGLRVARAVAGRVRLLALTSSPDRIDALRQNGITPLLGNLDAPDTLGKMLGPQRYQDLRQRKGLENDGLLLPAEIANTYFHLAHQHRSAWTHELDLRPYSDQAWWNHATSVSL